VFFSFFNIFEWGMVTLEVQAPGWRSMHGLVEVQSQTITITPLSPKSIYNIFRGEGRGWGVCDTDANLFCCKSLSTFAMIKFVVTMHESL